MTVGAQAIFEWLVLSVVVWSVSTTLSRARMLRAARGWVRRRSEFFGEGVTCQYCVSHWVAFVLTLLYRPRILPPAQWLETAWLVAVVDYLVSAFAVIGLAALLARSLGKTPPDGIHPDLAAEREGGEPDATVAADPTVRSALSRRSRPSRGSRSRRRPGRLPPYEPAVLPGWSGPPAGSRRTRGE